MNRGRFAQKKPRPRPRAERSAGPSGPRCYGARLRGPRVSRARRKGYYKLRGGQRAGAGAASSRRHHHHHPPCPKAGEIELSTVPPPRATRPRCGYPGDVNPRPSSLQDRSPALMDPLSRPARPYLPRWSPQHATAVPEEGKAGLNQRRSDPSPARPPATVRPPALCTSPTAASPRNGNGTGNHGSSPKRVREETWPSDPAGGSEEGRGESGPGGGRGLRTTGGPAPRVGKRRPACDRESPERGGRLKEGKRRRGMVA